ncbi:hypothetical protein P7C70_g324, partial [Phenoliferia sp. Uapishka_3]
MSRILTWASGVRSEPDDSCTIFTDQPIHSPRTEPLLSSDNSDVREDFPGLGHYSKRPEAIRHPRAVIFFLIALIISSTIPLLLDNHSLHVEINSFKSGDFHRDQVKTIASLQARLADETSRHAEAISEIRATLNLTLDDLGATATLLGRTEVKLDQCYGKLEDAMGEVDRLAGVEARLNRCQVEARDAREDRKLEWESRVACEKEAKRQAKIYREGLKFDAVEVGKRLGTGGLKGDFEDASRASEPAREPLAKGSVAVVTPSPTSFPIGNTPVSIAPASQWLLDPKFKITKEPQTRIFDFTIDARLGSPDGFTRPFFVVNGQLDGPLIEANQGDTLQVRVQNNLNTGITLHWHVRRIFLVPSRHAMRLNLLLSFQGIAQNGSVWADGPHGITQCPIPPFASFLYNFTLAREDQFGTYWWHAHRSAMYGDGVLGPLIVHSPDDPLKRGKDYDIDQILFIRDHFHTVSTDIVDGILSAAGFEGVSSVLRSTLVPRIPIDAPINVGTTGVFNAAFNFTGSTGNWTLNAVSFEDFFFEPGKNKLTTDPGRRRRRRNLALPALEEDVGSAWRQQRELYVVNRSVKRGMMNYGV